MNVYFAAFNVEMSKGSNVEYLYLPYSTGTVWAYANLDARIKDNFVLAEMFIKKDDPQKIVDGLNDPAVFGFSSYVWNHNYNIELARLVKKNYPECVIVFGGPSVPLDARSFLAEHHYIDYAVLQEGEISFRDILLDVLGYPVEFFGVASRSGKPQGKSKRIMDLDAIPSPFTAGYFDHILEKHKGKNVVFNAVIESNRGCPFGCTFCDWGQVGQQKVKTLEMCRVHEDLLWCAKNDVDMVQFADANFGAFKDRDMQIVKYFVELNKRYGAPRLFNASWHKNIKQEQVKMAELLVKHGLLRGFKVSFQTLNEKSLESIKRTNITLEQFDNIMAMAEKQQVPVTVDLMLPLPGQTAKDFYDDLDYMFERDVLVSLNPTTILPGAEMYEHDYRKQHGLITRMNHMPTTMGRIPEDEEWLVGTNTMSTDEYEHVFLTAWTMASFHSPGFSDWVAKYYKRKFGISFTRFYEGLWTFLADKNLHTSRYINPLLGHVASNNTSKLWGGRENIPMYRDLGVKNRKKFFEDLRNFCIMCLPHTDVLDELIELQYHHQNWKGKDTNTKVTCSSNLLEYIEGQADHLPSAHQYNFRSRKYTNKISSLADMLTSGRFSRTWENKISRRRQAVVV